jgi:hypothetical protein
MTDTPSVNFREHVLEPAEAADKHIADIGGLPEISRASADLRAAIDQTGQEIDTAQFASRYSRKPSDYLRIASDGSNLTPSTRMAIDEEGEAGLKRSELRARLMNVSSGLAGLVDELVQLRADLDISQQEF